MVRLNKIYFYLFMFMFILNFFMSILLLSLDTQLILEFNILSFNSVMMDFILIFDWVSFMFSSFVFFISSLIMKYSGGYMDAEKFLNRFIILMVLFVFSMMLMIFSPNLISILLGWDGLGLVSYALVIYYQNVKSYNAGMLTALSNRVGDAALLMSIALMMHYGSWNVFNYSEFYCNMDMFLIGGFIFLASLTKSAQIPFSSWLPAAMAAPTPVSSLVHSSTLVTAGVYLLIRFNSALSPLMMNILMYLSLMTMFMAGLAANFEYDLKKIIALSTLSQLGMMIFILSIGSIDLAFFHLLTHAFFKALLFMCAGAMIHNLGDCQDIRFMGGIINYFPLTCACFNISNLSLCGIPFLSGFYSKDLMAEILSMSNVGVFIYFIFFLSIGLTVSYSMRLTYFIFMGEFYMMNMNFLVENHNKIMLESMAGLVGLVICMGSVLSWILFPIMYFIVLPYFLKILTLVMILGGVFLGYEVAQLKFYYAFKFFSFKNYWFFSNMWNMPILSTYGVSYSVLAMGKSYFKDFDYGWSEYYGSKMLFFNLKSLSQFMQNWSIVNFKLFLLLIYIFMLFIMMLSF